MTITVIVSLKSFKRKFQIQKTIDCCIYIYYSNVQIMKFVGKMPLFAGHDSHVR